MDISNPQRQRNFQDQSLPGWCYNNAEFHELERQELMLSNWILACGICFTAFTNGSASTGGTVIIG